MFQIKANAHDRGLMRNDDIDDLARQLERLRIRREEAARVIQETNRAEEEIITRIRRARAANPSRRLNPHRPGDIVRITNVLRDEYGTVGTVLPPSTSTSRLIRIRNQSSNREYQRGWWNLELVEAAPSRRDSKNTTTSTTNTTSQ